MSRSFKKNPVVTDNGHSKKGKQLANRKLRRHPEGIGNFSDYKKHTLSYDICDYRFRKTENDMIKSLKNPCSGVSEQFESEEAALEWWRKTYKGK